MKALKVHGFVMQFPFDTVPVFIGSDQRHAISPASRKPTVRSTSEHDILTEPSRRTTQINKQKVAAFCTRCQVFLQNRIEIC